LNTASNEVSISAGRIAYEAKGTTRNDIKTKPGGAIVVFGGSYGADDVGARKARSPES
jgi:hypothetical protein